MANSEYRQITGIIVGCGNRGQNYAEYAGHCPERFCLIAIADPRSVVREKLQKLYSLEDKYVYDDWRQLANSNIERLADCAIITLPDREHHEAAVQLAKKGYHILLEKPMATKLEHCKEIVQVCRDNNVLLAVCHVLRYLPVVKKIKELLDKNVIGKLISIQHIEPVGKNNKLIFKINCFYYLYRFSTFCSFICTW
jgi:predicted dehydrogenase